MTPNDLPKPFAVGGTVLGKVAAGALAIGLVALFAVVIFAHNGGRNPGSGAGTPTASSTETVLPTQPQPSPSGWVTSVVNTNDYAALGWKAAQVAGAGTLQRFAFSPSSPNIGYACSVQINVSITVSKTTDSGATWRQVTGMLPGDATMSAHCDITVDPTNPQDVVVVRASGACTCASWVVRSLDGGTTWTRPTGLSMDPYRWGWAGSTLLVSTQLEESATSLTELFKSVNGGSFVEIDKQGMLGSTKAEAIYLLTGAGSTYTVAMGPTPMFNTGGTSNVVVRSTDGGATWNTFSYSSASGTIALISTGPDEQALVGMTQTSTPHIAVSRSGQPWQTLPPLPSGVPAIPGNLYVISDGRVFATSSTQGHVSNPDNRVFSAHAGDSQWQVAATLPVYSTLVAISTDASGHPTTLWATYSTDSRGTSWLLISHPV